MVKNLKKILLFSPSIGDYLTYKIERCLKKSSYVNKVYLVGLSRSELSINNNKRVLGNVKSRSYFSRLILYPKLFFKLRELLKEYDIIYTWSLDASIISLIAAKSLKGKKFIYGYSDVHNMCTKKVGLFPKIFRFLEAFIARHSDMVVFTSPLFKTEYFEKMLGVEIENYSIIENKIERECADLILKNYTPKSFQNNDIVFGYFGILAYMDAFEFIKKASCSGIKTIIRGLIGREGKENELIKGFTNLEYAGKYKNPDDIAEMFSKIDISWLIYSFRPKTNYQWAMANRFYEALMMQTPIVVQAGTSHEEFILKHNIGLSIDIYSPEESIEKLKSITTHDFEEWKKNLKRIDKSVYLLEYSEYDDMLKKL